MKIYLGKVALVTDCSTNYGIAIIKSMAKEGMVIIAFGKDQSVIINVKKRANFDKNANIVLLHCDITSKEYLQEAFSYIKNNYKSIDVLINNATCDLSCQVSDGSVEAFNEIINTNINALVACTNLVSKFMLQRGSTGHIINMNDIEAYEIPTHGNKSVYLASKVSVTAINEILRLEFRYLNADIKVTNIACGGFEDDQEKIRDLVDVVMDVIDTPEHLQLHEILLQWDPVNSFN